MSVIFLRDRYILTSSECCMSSSTITDITLCTQIQYFNHHSETERPKLVRTGFTYMIQNLNVCFTASHFRLVVTAWSCRHCPIKKPRKCFRIFEKSTCLPENRTCDSPSVQNDQFHFQSRQMFNHNHSITGISYIHAWPMNLVISILFHFLPFTIWVVMFICVVVVRTGTATNHINE